MCSNNLRSVARCVARSTCVASPRHHRLVFGQEHVQGNTSGFRLLLCQGNRLCHSHSLSEGETVRLPFRQRAKSRFCYCASGFHLSEVCSTLKLTAAGIRSLSTFLSLMLAILLQLCSFHSLLRRVERLSLRDENFLADFSMPLNWIRYENESAKYMEWMGRNQLMRSKIFLSNLKKN